jgi:aspartate-semialdehyde dehydrogenase
MRNGLKVAVVGATGAVGHALLSILEKRRFPVRELVLFSSPRSEGKKIEWNGKSLSCQVLSKKSFEGVDLAFFDASDAVSSEWVPKATEAGAWVVDNSGAFRLDDDIFLLVPEVNGSLLEERLRSKPLTQFSPRERILTGPNCAAAPLVMALKPLQERWGVKRVVVSTYQSTSGAGAAAMAELSTQTSDYLNKKPLHSQAFHHQIAFNCIPHIGSFKGDGYTSEEQKIMAETRKMLGLPQLRISATAVRVPTFSCHAESVNVECERPFDLEEVYKALRDQPGLVIQDDVKKNVYPLGMAIEGDPVESATGKDPVYIGRIRKDFSLEYGLNFWLVSDNLRKGAALNAVQLGELLYKSLQ